MCGCQGGNHPLNSAMDDSDDDFDQLGPSPGDSELEKVCTAHDVYCMYVLHVHV